MDTNTLIAFIAWIIVVAIIIILQQLKSWNSKIIISKNWTLSSEKTESNKSEIKSNWANLLMDNTNLWKTEISKDWIKTTSNSVEIERIKSEKEITINNNNNKSKNDINFYIIDKLLENRTEEEVKIILLTLFNWSNNISIDNISDNFKNNYGFSEKWLENYNKMNSNNFEYLNKFLNSNWNNEFTRESLINWLNKNLNLWLTNNSSNSDYKKWWKYLRIYLTAWLIKNSQKKEGKKIIYLKK